MLILTDRSRQEDGGKDCLRKRWWKYHSVDGYGITLRAARADRSVGLAVHAALAHVMAVVKLSGGKVDGDIFGRGPLVPPRPMTQMEEHARVHARAAIHDARTWFTAEWQRGQGFAGGALGEPPSRERQAYILTEQGELLEGMAWGWLRGQFPEIARRFEVLEVEREESYVVDCTCGLGPGGWLAEHDARGCTGVGHQARPDLVMLERNTGEVGIHDFKTSKTLGQYDVDQYRVSIQMAANTLCVEQRIGRPVTHYYVHSLLKGQYKESYEPASRGFTGDRKQNSPWCYVEYLPPAPPLRRTDEVANELQWYKRTPAWEVNWIHKPAAWTNAEYLAQVMPLPVLQQQFSLIGPYPRQGWLCKRYMRAMAAEERRWQQRVWDVYDMVQAGMDIEDALDAVVPQSWGCFKYGAEAGPCEFLWICTGEGVSAKDPLASGLYIKRMPHHQYELERRDGHGTSDTSDTSDTKAEEGSRAAGEGAGGARG